MILDHCDDRHALIIEILLNLLLVGLEGITELLILWVLLDGTDGSNGTSVGSNLVLETY